MDRDKIDRDRLQADLLEVFGRHGVEVGVGLINDGVAIRSQDERVDVLNIGTQIARPAAGSADGDGG